MFALTPHDCGLCVEHPCCTPGVAQAACEVQRLVEKVARRRRVSVETGQFAEAGQRRGQTLWVAQVAPELEALLELLASRFHVAQQAGDVCKLMQRTCYAPRISGFARERDAVLVPGPRQGIVAALTSHISQII